jgi:AcrR family transcriptional regulator
MTRNGDGEDQPKTGLRERKKARTRATLQEHALRLFREQGYGETSIEQIAEAAEVSPATVYRYFPTKADLVIYDDLDDLLIEAYRAQPARLSPLEALRASIVAGFGGLLGEALEVQRDRERLIRTEPELRAAMLDEFTRTLREIAVLIGERANRPPNDEVVLSLAGAVLGVTMAVWFGSGEDDFGAFVQRLDTALRHLETGFRL